MGTLGGNPSTQMAGLESSFQSEENNSMLAEEIKEYALASAEEDYKEPGKHATMVFMYSGGEFHDGNDSHWEDQKQPSFIR